VRLPGLGLLRQASLPFWHSNPRGLGSVLCLMNLMNPNPPLFTLPRPTVAPVATVFVLNTLQPLVAALRAGLQGLSPAAARRLERRVHVNGSSPIYRGSPERAREIEASLRAAGLTTSVNLLV
jgi:hypothetical protein